MADVWIAVDGSHLVQIEVDTEIGPFLRVQFAGLGVMDAAAMSSVMMLSRHGEPVDIEAPDVS